jgi:hypothetical protein
MKQFAFTVHNTVRNTITAQYADSDINKVFTKVKEWILENEYNTYVDQGNPDLDELTLEEFGWSLDLGDVTLRIYELEEEKVDKLLFGVMPYYEFYKWI